MPPAPYLYPTPPLVSEHRDVISYHRAVISNHEYVRELLCLHCVTCDDVLVLHCLRYLLSYYVEDESERAIELQRSIARAPITLARLATFAGNLVYNFEVETVNG